MDKVISQFLLAGDKCMPEVHLKQPGFTYLKDLHLQNIIACFAHDASNSDSIVLLRELFLIRF